MTSHNSTKNTTIANANANMNSNAVNMKMKMTMTMNATRIHRLSKLLSVALLFFCQVETITASADEAAPATNANVNTNAGGFVSLKLTPRHVQLERRRRELHNVGVDVDADFDSAIDEQNRRRGEAVQVGALFEVSVYIISLLFYILSQLERPN